MSLTDEAVLRLQKKFYYLTNFTSSDPNAPIDPLSYRDAGGDNLLIIAAQIDDLKTIELLASAGTDLSEQGEMGNTALHYAYKRKNAEIIDFLLEHGASTSIENFFGKIPSDYAA